MFHIPTCSGSGSGTGNLAPNATADFYLTQIVSHHSADRVGAFLEECDQRGVDVPGIFGVFYYWSANAGTLGQLGEFFPVPAEELAREFEAGATPEEVLGKTLNALRAVGADKVYISNLGHRRVQDRLTKVTSQSTIGADASGRP